MDAPNFLYHRLRTMTAAVQTAKHLAGIEPAFTPWQGIVIAIILQVHIRRRPMAPITKSANPILTWIASQPSNHFVLDSKSCYRLTIKHYYINVC